MKITTIISINSSYCAKAQRIHNPSITFKYTAVFLDTTEESEMVTGTVKFFNRTKHFGFIAGDDGKDYFVHATGLKPGVSIAEGDKVSFDVVAGDKGPKADKVDKAT
jgi:CspA family cold shock protein